MKSLSIVCTQMQLVNCIEAIQEYGCRENDLLILAGNRNSLDKIMQLLRSYESVFRFNQVHSFYLKSTKFGIFNIIMQLLFITKSTKKVSYDILFSGNYKHAQQKYILRNALNVNNNANIVLVDDGLAVYEICDRRNHEIESGRSNIHYSSKAYKICYSCFLKNFLPPTITFFTLYKGLKIQPTDSLIFNKYTFSKKYSIGAEHHFSSGERIVFLGQPLIDNKSLGLNTFTKENYCNYIKHSLEFLHESCSRIVYFPHPAEDTATTLTNDFMLSNVVVRPTFPFELNAVHLPDNVLVIGFYTSALVNLHMAYPHLKIISLYFNEINESSIPRIKKVVNNAYDVIENEGIQVLFRNYD